jgi:putative ABC transport system permease protein
MSNLLASIRYSMRLLSKSPGFTLTAVLILGFGIGANTAIFSLINAVLLKPLPYPHPEQLMQVNMPSIGRGEWTSLLRSAWILLSTIPSEVSPNATFIRSVVTAA